MSLVGPAIPLNIKLWKAFCHDPDVQRVRLNEPLDIGFSQETCPEEKAQQQHRHTFTHESSLQYFVQPHACALSCWRILQDNEHD